MKIDLRFGIQLTNNYIDIKITLYIMFLYMSFVVIHVLVQRCDFVMSIYTKINIMLKIAFHEYRLYS